MYEPSEYLDFLRSPERYPKINKRPIQDPKSQIGSDEYNRIVAIITRLSISTGETTSGQSTFIIRETDWANLQADEEMYSIFCLEHKGWAVDVVADDYMPPITDRSVIDEDGTLYLSAFISDDGTLTLTGTIDDEGQLTL